MDLLTTNQALLQEFKRITGADNHFAFATWCAEQIRLTAHASHVQWDLLSRSEQCLRLLARLRGMPPASWPSLRLVASVEEETP